MAPTLKAFVFRLLLLLRAAQVVLQVSQSLICTLGCMEAAKVKKHVSVPLTWNLPSSRFLNQSPVPVRARKKKPKWGLLLAGRGFSFSNRFMEQPFI